MTQTILLTGANGYIGMRLLPVLVEAGYTVICLVRDQRRMEIAESLKSAVQFYEGDLLKPETLLGLPSQIEAAYYLVHSMGAPSGNFATLEQQAATNFVEAISRTTAKHIVYLSGIVNDRQLSTHLQSRKNVEDILLAGSVPVTVLRAAIIIGSGSASFEIIRDLVEKLPVMVAPKWLKTRCQPIAVRNVVQYLVGILLKPEAYGQVFDIGGPDTLSYKRMLLEFAKVRGLQRLILIVPVLTPRLSSLWLHFVTSTSYSLARSLVDSMVNEVVVERNGIENLVKVPLIPYQQAVQLAFDRIAQNRVLSSWKDSLNSSFAGRDLFDQVLVPQFGCLRDVRKYYFSRDPQVVTDNIWSIGGERGWYYLSFLWKVRGYLDKLVGGVGLRRGRRSPDSLVPGDALDFWRVLVPDKKEKRLLLYAEMKLPGEAWLEFRIGTEKDGRNYLLQTATFRPQGLFGRLYWYSVLPLHALIFPGMAKRIIAYGLNENEKRDLAITVSHLT
jgi:uncharacterized protein YbjT (DUF2867 family)